jgi:hypothetical protein
MRVVNVISNHWKQIEQALPYARNLFSILGQVSSEFREPLALKGCVIYTTIVPRSPNTGGRGSMNFGRWSLASVGEIRNAGVLLRVAPENGLTIGTEAGHGRSKNFSNLDYAVP